MFANDIGNRQQLFKAIGVLMLALLATLARDAAAESEPALTLEPDRCIALKEGQTCYQSIKVRWQAHATSDYCLLRNSEETPLVCWRGVQQGQTQLEVGADDSVTFRLLLTSPDTNDSVEVAHATLVVSWVYSKSKKRRNSWRLF